MLLLLFLSPARIDSPFLKGSLGSARQGWDHLHCRPLDDSHSVRAENPGGVPDSVAVPIAACCATRSIANRLTICTCSHSLWVSPVTTAITDFPHAPASAAGNLLHPKPAVVQVLSGVRMTLLTIARVGWTQRRPTSLSSAPGGYSTTYSPAPASSAALTATSAPARPPNRTVRDNHHTLVPPRVAGIYIRRQVSAASSSCVVSGCRRLVV